MAAKPTRTALIGSNVGPTVAPQFSASVRDLGQSVSSLAAGVQDVLFQKKAIEAEKQAIIDTQALTWERNTEGGLIPPDLPKSNGIFGPSLYEQKYAEQALLHYSNRLKLDTNAKAAELHREAAELNNPEAFRESWIKYQQTTVENASPHVQGTLDVEMTDLGQTHYQSLKNQRAQTDLNNRISANALVGEQIIRDNRSLMVHGTFQEIEENYKAFEAWRDKSVRSEFMQRPQADALTLDVQRQLATDAVVRNLMEIPNTEEGLNQRLELIEQVKKGNLTVSVPGVGTKDVAGLFTPEELAKQVSSMRQFAIQAEAVRAAKQDFQENLQYGALANQVNTWLIESFTDGNDNFDEILDSIQAEFSTDLPLKQQQLLVTAARFAAGGKDAAGVQQKNETIDAADNVFLRNALKDITPEQMASAGLESTSLDSYLADAKGSLEVENRKLKSLASALGSASDSINKSQTKMMGLLSQGLKRREAITTAFMDNLTDEQKTDLEQGDPTLNRLLREAQSQVVINLGTSNAAQETMEAMTQQRYSRLAPDTELDWQTMDLQIASVLIRDMKKNQTISTSMAQFLEESISLPLTDENFSQMERSINFYDQLLDASPHMGPVLKDILPNNTAVALREVWKRRAVLNAATDKIEDVRTKALMGENIYGEWENLPDEIKAKMAQDLELEFESLQTGGLGEGIGQLFNKQGWAGLWESGVFGRQVISPPDFVQEVKDNAAMVLTTNLHNLEPWEVIIEAEVMAMKQGWHPSDRDSDSFQPRPDMFHALELLAPTFAAPAMLTRVRKGFRGKTETMVRNPVESFYNAKQLQVIDKHIRKDVMPQLDLIGKPKLYKNVFLDFVGRDVNQQPLFTLKYVPADGMSMTKVSETIAPGIEQIKILSFSELLANDEEKAEPPTNPNVFNMLQQMGNRDF